jgi:hypothetical protein
VLRPPYTVHLFIRATGPVQLWGYAKPRPAEPRSLASPRGRGEGQLLGLLPLEIRMPLLSLLRPDRLPAERTQRTQRTQRTRERTRRHFQRINDRLLLPKSARCGRTIPSLHTLLTHRQSHCERRASWAVGQRSFPVEPVSQCLIADMHLTTGGPPEASGSLPERDAPSCTSTFVPKAIPTWWSRFAR